MDEAELSRMLEEMSASVTPTDPKLSGEMLSPLRKVELLSLPPEIKVLAVLGVQRPEVPMLWPPEKAFLMARLGAEEVGLLASLQM